jgi:hypothetical protein
MPVIRLRRTDSNAPAPAVDPVPTPSGDLEGFDSEASPPLALPAAPQPARRSRGWLSAFLGVLVLIEAVPAGLWVRDYLSARPEFRAELPAVAAPALPLVATAPCEPAAAPEPAPPAPTPVAPAAAAAGAVAAAEPVIAAGILAVDTPIPLQVFSRGRMVGTTEAETLMLAAGAYDFEFVNETVGYRTRRSATVQAGRRTSLRVDVPQGTLHVNAVPWAEVSLAGQRLGETPIGNAQVPLGSHELVFRHPELGERRSRVLVTLKEPARISIDMRKP